jgi:undecaprenyl-diphosphatase
VDRVAGGIESGGRYRLSGWLIALVAAEAAVFGCALALSAVAAAHGDPFAGDVRLMRWVQDIGSWFEPVAKAMRWVNGTEGVLLIAAVCIAGLWLWGKRWEPATLAIALLAVLVLQPILKDIVDRPRPDPTIVDRRAGFDSESFPSGHMMTGFVLFAMLGVIAWGLPLARPIRVAIVVVVVALLVLNGTSSVYLGVHWPTDIAGGVLWGAVIVLPAAGVLHERRERERKGT